LAGWIGVLYRREYAVRGSRHAGMKWYGETLAPGAAGNGIPPRKQIGTPRRVPICPYLCGGGFHADPKL
jgi:hypothetical protein